jgi:hypothetical protein
MTATSSESALDLSNWTSDPDQSWYDRLRPEANVSTIIPQAISPPSGYPPGVTVQQGDKALAAGLNLNFYLWLWFDIADPIGDLRRKLDLITKFSGQVKRLALDVEDSTVPAPDQGGDAARYVDLTEQALAVLSEYPVVLGPPMVYSGPWFWLRWMANSWQFKDRYPVWPADYNGATDDVDNWQWFGGWSTALFHQHTGTSTVLGVGNVDQNAIAASEALAMAAGNPNPPTPQPDINPLVVPFAHVADIVVADSLNNELARKSKKGAALAPRRGIIEKVVADTVSIRTAALGQRPSGLRSVREILDRGVDSQRFPAQAGEMALHMTEFAGRARLRHELRKALVWS